MSGAVERRVSVHSAGEAKTRCFPRERLVRAGWLIVEGGRNVVREGADDPFGMLRRVRDRVVTTHRLTDQHEPLEPHLVHERFEIGDVVLRAVAVGRHVLGVTVATLLQEVDVVVSGEVLRDTTPRAPDAGQPLKEEHDRSAGARGGILDIMKT